MQKEEFGSLIITCLRDFYSRRILKLQSLKMRSFLARKNPYLLKAIGISKASELTEKLLSDFIAASDETMFRDAVLEPIARVVSGGRTSKTKGIHFTISLADRVTAVALRSGANTLNSGQSERQKQQLASAGKKLSETRKSFEVILGHACGKSKRSHIGSRDFRELSGQAFWSEISGDPNFYIQLLNYMQNEPDQHKEEYSKAWQVAVDKLNLEFQRDFCLSNGDIDWGKILVLTSGGET
jgi:hypothetical protein